MAGRILLAWIVTLPAAACCAAGAGNLIHAIGPAGSSTGPVVATIIAVFLCVMGYAARRSPVTADNVNDDLGERRDIEARVAPA